MLLIAAGFAVALASAAPAETAPASLPPVAVAVIEAPGISATLVSQLLAETDAIWRAAGVSFLWRRGLRDVMPPPASDTGPWLPATMLRVVIGKENGTPRDHRTPLGWIVFDDERTPHPEIYLSYTNAWALLIASRPVVGIVEQMPILRREMLLARAMGRALAHELGHYLLASKLHTRRGLLQASRTASELFSPERRGFRIEQAQSHQIAARLAPQPPVAKRW